MVKIFRSRRFWHVAGVASLVAAFSYNAGRLLDLTTLKQRSPRTAPAAKQPVAGRSLSAYGPAVEKNVFGIQGATFSVLEKKSAGPATDAQGLVLRGVITHRPGFAFIENKDKLQRMFKVGDDVFGAGVLKTVEPKKAILSVGGRGVELPLFGTVAEESGKMPSAPGQPGKGGTNERNFDKEQIKKFLDNPKEILTDARLLPNMKDGRQEGFLVREVRPGGFYDNIGLANGDVILRANNIDLSSPGDGVKIFNMIKELDRVELDILRGGVRSTQVYHIR